MQIEQGVIPSGPRMREHRPGAPRLVYPPLVVPIPSRLTSEDAVAAGNWVGTLMDGPAWVAAGSRLRALTIDPPQPASPASPQPRRRGADNARPPRWVVARTARVPPGGPPPPADAGGRSWACPLCIRPRPPYPSLRRLAAHMALRHGRGRLYVCGACATGEPQLFRSFAATRFHVLWHHHVDPAGNWRENYLRADGTYVRPMPGRGGPGAAMLALHRGDPPPAEPMWTEAPARRSGRVVTALGEVLGLGGGRRR